MKIKNAQINAFGNLENKQIDLSENINIIKGNNESGKSTFLKFIVDMFYGISKNKRGKEFSDYDRYKPWNSEEFSGKITYILDDGKKYEVFRDFNKKNPKIYNENLEDISGEFSINKTKGNQFFYEQTNIDEETLFSTAIAEQQGVALPQSSQNILTQKIANMLSTGDDNISYKKVMANLSKKQLEEVGTERTTGRPINNILKEIKKYYNPNTGELVMNGITNEQREYIASLMIHIDLEQYQIIDFLNKTSLTDKTYTYEYFKNHTAEFEFYYKDFLDTINEYLEEIKKSNTAEDKNFWITGINEELKNLPLDGKLYSYEYEIELIKKKGYKNEEEN